MRSAWLVAAMAIAVPMASPAFAQEDANSPPPQGPFVVLIGVGEYEDKAISSRPTADADAKLLYDVFSDPQYFPDGPKRVRLLTSKADDKRGGEVATRENIVKALAEAAEKTGRDDAIIVGWFGRGSSAGEKTALFATDTVLKDRATTAVLGADIEAELKNTNDRKFCLFMDVAFKGFDPGKESIPDPNLRDITAVVFGEDAIGDAGTMINRSLFLATDLGHDALSTKDGKYGLFAATLAAGLKGKADKEGYEPDGVITIDELAKFVESEITEKARELGETDKDKEALPRTFGEELGYFPLTKNPAVYDAVVKRLDKIKGLEKAGKLDEEVASEAENLLSRMPKLKSTQELRKKYQALADGDLTAEDFLTARKKMKDAMKLSGEKADDYARTVLRAADKLVDRYVKELNLGDLVEGGIRGLYRALDEPLPPEIDEDLKKANNLSRPKLASVLRLARQNLGIREDLDNDKDVDSTIRRMMASIKDDYTSYFDKELIKKTESQLRGEFSGIGIQIRRDSVRDGLLVVSPIKNSPAYRAGVKAGDLIVAIKRDVDPEGKPLAEGEPKEITTKGMKVERALELILGLPGVPVTVVVDREGESQPLEFTITRGRVAVETVLGIERNEKDDWKYYIDKDSKIAYVRLTQFSRTTAQELEEALTKLRGEGVQGLVLDLRMNPGGLLSTAAQVCNLFIDDGLVVTTRFRSQPDEFWYARGDNVLNVKDRRLIYRAEGRKGKAFTEFPMAILVNGQSASASEIVAACLQDYNRAVVIGERTFGKGSVQSIEEFKPTDGQMKMTIARYFPPLGRNIDKLSTPSRGKDETEEWGVKPDKGYEVKLEREDREALAESLYQRELIKRKDLPEKEQEKPFIDKQAEKALDYLRSQIKAAGRDSDGSKG